MLLLRSLSTMANPLPRIRWSCWMHQPNLNNKYRLERSIDPPPSLWPTLIRTLEQYQAICWNQCYSNFACIHQKYVDSSLWRLAEEVGAIIKGLVSKGGYKNVIGLSSSIGKDVIPRVAGYFAAQPIGDITEVVVNQTSFREKTLMSGQLMLEMPSPKSKLLKTLTSWPSDLQISMRLILPRETHKLPRYRCQQGQRLSL